MDSLLISLMAYYLQRQRLVMMAMLDLNPISLSMNNTLKAFIYNHIWMPIN
jgi:hypothetical protein